MNAARIPRHSDIRLTPTLAFFLTAFILTAVYSATAQWHPPYNIDALTNALTAWSIANDGTPILQKHEGLTEPEQFGNLAWVGESPTGPISQYPPGTAAVAVPLYWLAPDDPLRPAHATNDPAVGATEVLLPVLWPATLAAVLATAFAHAVLAYTLIQVGWRQVDAALMAIAVGVATTAWPVASSALFSHGPSMLWIALALLMAQRRHWLLGGLCIGAAILNRPHLAVIAASMGLGLAFHYRSWRPAIGFALGSSTGMALLLIFNYHFYRTTTLVGGYSTTFVDQFVTSDLSWYLSNIGSALVSPTYGLLIYSPFLIPLAISAVATRTEAPPWAAYGAIGGVLYLLIQLRANRASGGYGHFAYRYPLEALAASWPFLLVGFRSWVDRHALRLRITVACFVAAAIIQATGAMTWM